MRSLLKDYSSRLDFALRVLDVEVGGVRGVPATIITSTRDRLG